MDPFTLALLIGGAASAVGGIANAIGSGQASAAQEKAAREAMQLQKEMWSQQRADQAPWLQAGRTTLADLLQQMQAGGFETRMDPSQVANDPGFQFRMAEGQKALERSASARGMLNSGGALKSLARYSQGLASDEFQNAWARQQSDASNRFNRLASLAGVGQASAQNIGAMGGQYAGNMGQLYGAIGNAQAAGAMGMGNAVAGTMGQLGGLGMYRALQPPNPQIPMQPGSPGYRYGGG